MFPQLDLSSKLAVMIKSSSWVTKHAWPLGDQQSRADFPQLAKNETAMCILLGPSPTTILK